MEISVVGRHVDITPAIREYALRRVSKLEKHLQDVQKVQVTLNIEGDRHKAELVITPARGAPLVSAESSNTMYAALDLVVDKAGRQLDRYKDKIKERRERGKTVATGGSSAGAVAPAGSLEASEKSVKLLDFLVEEAIIDDLRAPDREGAITEIVGSLAKVAAIPRRDAKDVTRAILKREELGSTGVGRGIAVPHAKHKSAKQIVGTLARSHKGIEFNSLDGGPVHLLFLLVSPLDSTLQHMRALERISSVIKDATFCRFLMRAADKQELAGLLKEADEGHFRA